MAWCRPQAAFAFDWFTSEGWFEITIQVVLWFVIVPTLRCTRRLPAYPVSPTSCDACRLDIVINFCTGYREGGYEIGL